MQNSVLFTPAKLGPLDLKNRFMRSATWEGLGGSTGLPKQQLASNIEELAAGGVGLITTGAAFPSFDGRVVSNQIGMAMYAHSQLWAPIVRTVHRYGAKILFQLSHGGTRSAADLSRKTPIGPTADLPNTREMTIPEIEKVVHSFTEAALRCQSIGADGIQLQCAHGWLLSQFLSPAINKRTDMYGGNVENRVRIVQEIVHEIRSVTSPKFCISVKINGHDCRTNGVVPELAARYIEALPSVDFFEISCGIGPKSFTIRSIPNPNAYALKIPEKDIPGFMDRVHAATDNTEYTDAYNLPYAKTIKRLVPSAKLAVVGGMRNIRTMERAVSSGVTELISMSRPFLKEPRLVNDLQSGKIKRISCTSCGLCDFNRTPGIKCQNFQKDDEIKIV